jgi:hypothetical protein
LTKKNTFFMDGGNTITKRESGEGINVDPPIALQLICQLSHIHLDISGLANSLQHASLLS